MQMFPVSYFCVCFLVLKFFWLIYLKLPEKKNEKENQLKKYLSKSYLTEKKLCFLHRNDCL